MLYIVKKQQHWEDKRYVSGQKSSARAEPPEECSVCLDIVFTCKHHQKCCKYHILGQTADEWGGCRSFRKFQNVLKMAKAKKSVFYYTFCVLYRITAFINRLWGFKNSNVLWIFYNHRLTVKAMNCRKKSMFVSLLLPVCLCFCLGSMHTCAYCLNTACFRKYSFYLLCVCDRKKVCVYVCVSMFTDIYIHTWKLWRNSSLHCCGAGCNLWPCLTADSVDGELLTSSGETCDWNLSAHLWS